MIERANQADLRPTPVRARRGILERVSVPRRPTILYTLASCCAILAAWDLARPLGLIVTAGCLLVAEWRTDGS